MATGTLASETVIPAGLYENNRSGVGAAAPAVGVMRIEPEDVVGVSPEVASFAALRFGIEYGKELLVWLPIVTLVALPAGFANCNVPVIGPSVGFTRRTCVVQPPPSAKWGITAVPVFAAVAMSITGSVDMRNSPRSFV